MINSSASVTVSQSEGNPSGKLKKLSLNPESRVTIEYTNSVNGKINAPVEGVINPLYIGLQVDGDLPGTLKSSIQYNNSNMIVGGEWTHTVVKRNVDGSTTTLGTITGTYSGGTVSVSGSEVISINEALMVIEGGTGAYGGIGSGRGNLSGSFNGSAPLPFNGTLLLSF